jgi:glycosyltransferase involved in cell wall biosynthesis
VAVLNWRDPWHRAAGGAECHAYRIGLGLLAAGASVDFLTARERGRPRREVRDGIRWLRLGGRWTVYPATFARLLVRRRRYDAVLDCQNGIPFLAPLAVSRRSRVLIVVHHVHDRQFGTHFPRPVAALGRWLEGPVSRRVYRRSTAIAVSPSTIAAMRARLGWRGPIVCVPNGVCAAAPRDAGRVRHPTPRVVAVGRLVRHKRLEHVVGLVDELAGLYPDLDLHVIGRGPDEPRVRAAAARCAHPERVTVHGYLPAAERDALLSTAWLHVCASQGEGWSLSALEAAAWGVPTLAYDVEGLRDAVRHRETGWLVADPGAGSQAAPGIGAAGAAAGMAGPRDAPGDDPARGGDAAGLLAEGAAKALTVLADPHQAERIAADCRDWAGRFSWARSAAWTAALIEAELAARRRSSR